MEQASVRVSRAPPARKMSLVMKVEALGLSEGAKSRIVRRDGSRGTEIVWRSGWGIGKRLGIEHVADGFQ
jgi:hypothetical protein